MSSNFVPVPPGGTMDPYVVDDDRMFFDCYQTRPDILRTPGTYRFRFVYDASSPDLAQWRNGQLAGDIENAKEIARLFPLVPKTLVKSNEITIEMVAPTQEP